MLYAKFPVQFGKYVLLERINSGGMAEIYRARHISDTSIRRLVAIKCMLPNLLQDEQFTRMFIDEAKWASQLDHENIARIYELGRVDRRLYIAMEHVAGCDMGHVVKRAQESHFPIPAGFAAYVVSKAAEGLDAAHRKTTTEGKPLNLVHHDVTPQNILISYEGQVKVVDFGIARAGESTAKQDDAGGPQGKYAYMAPEQVMGRATDRRTDIFALGCVLFEIVTGERLFGGDSELSVLEKVRDVEHGDLRKRLGNMASPVLFRVLERALQPEPSHRFQYAADMAEALSPLLIDHNSIFGAKKAMEFMRCMYAEDIEQLNQRVQSWVAEHEGEEDAFSRHERVEEVLVTGLERADTDLDPLPIKLKPTPTPVPGQLRATDSKGERLGKRLLIAFSTVLAVGVIGMSVLLIAVGSGSRNTLSGGDGAPNFREILGKPKNPAVMPDLEPVARNARESARVSRKPLGRASEQEGFTQNKGIAHPPETVSGGKPTSEGRARRNPKRGTVMRHGFVSIDVADGPQAQVFLNGEKIGRTPIEAHRVALGKHRIRVQVSEGKKSFQKAMEVTISPRNSKKQPHRIVVRP